LATYFYDLNTSPGTSRYRWPDGDLWSNIEDPNPTPGTTNINMVKNTKSKRQNMKKTERRKRRR